MSRFTTEEWRRIEALRSSWSIRLRAICAGLLFPAYYLNTLPHLPSWAGYTLVAALAVLLVFGIAFADPVAERIAYRKVAREK